LQGRPRHFVGSPGDDDSGKDLPRLVSEFGPDALVMACSPSEMGVHILYAFSMPCAVGLGAQFELIRGGSLEPDFDGGFRSGNAFEAAITEAWVRRLPVVSGGWPGGGGKRNHDGRLFYVASRVVDLCTLSEGLGRPIRLLVVAPEDGIAGLEAAVGTLLRGDGSAPYMPEEADPRVGGSTVIGGCLAESDLDQSGCPDREGLARCRFRSEMAESVQSHGVGGDVVG